MENQTEREVAFCMRAIRELTAAKNLDDRDGVAEWLDELDVLSLYGNCASVRNRAAREVAANRH